MGCQPPGIARTFWKNGKLKEKGSTEKGKRQGVWKAWYNDGTQMALGKYHQGIRVGTWTYWDESGAFERLERYPAVPIGSALNLAAEDFEKMIEEQPDNWQLLLLSAAYVIERESEQQVSDRQSLEKALGWIDRSIRLNENFNNVSTKVRLLERYDYQNAMETAIRAIELGLDQSGEFEGSDKHKALVRITEKPDGC